MDAVTEISQLVLEERQARALDQIDQALTQLIPLTLLSS
jgi:hypothetical protein